MSHRIQSLIFASLLLAVHASGSPAQAALMISSADTYIRSSAASTNFSSSDSMVSNLYGSDVRMAIFCFDLNAVPPGTISSAKLQLQDVIGSANQSYQVWGLLDAYEMVNEATLTWNTASFLTGTSIDASKMFGGAKLGDFSNVANSVNTVFDVTSGNYLNFLNSSSNNLVTFVIVDTNSSGSGSGWATKENLTALSPSLTITGISAIPEPSTVGLLATGILVCGGFYLRKRPR